MLLQWKTKHSNSLDWDIIIWTKFDKSGITALLKGSRSNLCPVYFVHLFTTGAIFNQVSEGYLHGQNLTEISSYSSCSLKQMSSQDFSYPYMSEFGILKQNRHNPDEKMMVGQSE